MLATRMLRDPFVADLRMVDDAFNRFFGITRDANRVTGWTPALDVHETEDEYVLYLDLPGVKQEDVSVELNDTILSISGVRTPVELGNAQRVERPYGSFARTLTLPQGIDPDKVTASMTDGVLSLTVPKPERMKPKTISIGSGSERRELETATA